VTAVDDLLQFLMACLANEETIAKAACHGGDGQWRLEDPNRRPGRVVDGAGDVVVHDEGSPSDKQAWHITRHDPARVLREIDAKRRILSEIVPEMNRMDDQLEAEFGTPSVPEPYESEQLLRLLALPYADRPGYREEWRP
jgi:hypothetical protein